MSSELGTAKGRGVCGWLGVAMLLTTLSVNEAIAQDDPDAPPPVEPDPVEGEQTTAPDTDTDDAVPPAPSPSSLPPDWLPEITRPQDARPLSAPRVPHRRHPILPLMGTALGGALCVGSWWYVRQDEFLTAREWDLARQANAGGFAIVAVTGVWSVSDLIWNHARKADQKRYLTLYPDGGEQP